MSDQLALEYWSLDRIVAAMHPENEKAHTIELIESAIDRFGFMNPVRVDERTGLLGAGHGRCEALLLRQALAKPEPSGIFELDGVWQVPVIRGWASKDDAEAAAARVADNQTTIEAGFKPAALLTTLLEAQRAPGGLAGIGFTEQFVVDLRAMLNPPPSLEDLAGEHLVPPERALWPSLRFQIQPEYRDRYFELVGRRAVADENDNFGFMLSAAEAQLDVEERATVPDAP